MSPLGPVKNPSNILFRIWNIKAINKVIINGIEYFPKIVTNRFNDVIGRPILNITNKILDYCDKKVYLVVNILDISCKYLKFLLYNYVDIYGYSVNT